MEPMVLSVFQREVAEQCEFGIAAAHGVNAGLDQDQRQVWASLQALITAAANVHKLLWGAPGRRTADLLPDRPETLRASLGVDDSSPLASNEVRDFRNDLEHFDERLDAWTAADPRRIFVDHYIGSPDGIVIEGHVPQSFHREFNPDGAVYSFWGRTYHLNPIVAELERIGVVAAQKASEWPPRPGT